MVHTLTVLIKSCRGDHRPDCPILQRLETDQEDEDLSIKPRSGASGRPLQPCRSQAQGVSNHADR